MGDPLAGHGRTRPPTSLTWDRTAEATVNIKGLTREGYAVFRVAGRDPGQSLQWFQDHWLVELGIKNYGDYHTSERRRGLFENLRGARRLDAGPFDLGGSGGVSSVSLRTDLILPWLLYKFVRSADHHGRSPLTSTVGAWLQISVDGLSRAPLADALTVGAHFEGRLVPDRVTLDHVTGVVRGWGEVVAASPRIARGWPAFLAGAGKLSNLRVSGESNSVTSVVLYLLSDLSSRVGEARQTCRPGAQALLSFLCKALAISMGAYILYHRIPVQDPGTRGRLEEPRCAERRRRLDPQAIVAAMQRAREVAGSSNQTVTAVIGSKDLDGRISYAMSRMHRDMMKNSFKHAATLAMTWDPGGYSRRSYNIGLIAHTAVAAGDTVAGDMCPKARPISYAIAADFAFKAARKNIDLQYLADDPELSEAWAPDKLDREAAFLTMCVVLAELVHITGRQLADFCAPSNMDLRPVQNGEKRLLLDGAQFLFNEHEATAA
ncbi:unnamed protein product, partial [Prorocentrum cordatum]